MLLQRRISKGENDWELLDFSLTEVKTPVTLKQNAEQKLHASQWSSSALFTFTDTGKTTTAERWVGND